MGSSDRLPTLDQQDAADREQRYVRAMLATRGVPERLHYAAGVLLDTTDFEDEQAYHRAQLGRALTALFGFGTLAGLRVSHSAAALPGDNSTCSVEVHVKPGLALDRLGRLIEVRREQCLKVEDWLASRDAAGDIVEPTRTAEVKAAVVGAAGSRRLLLDVWLRYLPCAHGRTPAFAAGPFNATDYTVPARLADGFEMSLELAADKDGTAVPVNGLPPLDQVLTELQAEGNDTDRRQARLAWSVDNVLDRTWITPSDSAPDQLAKLAEHRQEAAWVSVLLARLAVPVSDDPFPRVAAKARVDAAAAALVDNRLRPIVFIPTAWRGQVA